MNQSNYNIKNRHIKSSNKNNFNKSSKYKKSKIPKINFKNNNFIKNNFYQMNTNNDIYNSIDFSLTKANTNKGNYLLHFPYKDCFKSSILSNKKEKNNNKKYTLKISNSNKYLSFNGINSKHIYNSTRKNTHNIRLNLNNEIINNKNFVTENNRRMDPRQNKEVYYVEKIKEKENRINRLKKDIIASEILLNELKNKDDNFQSINYDDNNSNSNSNSNSNFNNDTFNKNVNSQINIGSLLTFNYINNNNIHYNSHFKKSLSPENRIHKNNGFYYNFYNNSSSSKNENKNKIIFIRKTSPFAERNIYSNNSSSKDNFNDFVEKCNKLKNRAKILFNKYFKLSEAFSFINKAQ